MAPHAELPILTGATDTQAATISDPILTESLTYSRFTVDDVLPHRTRAIPLAKGVAAFASAEMFKSKGCLQKPKAQRFDHRISKESRNRQASSLKEAMKYMTKDTISLCGGLPSSDYFPFDKISATVPQAPYFSEQETIEHGVTTVAGKHDVNEGNAHFDLSIALNYGQGMGPPQMLRYATEHTEIVHNPPYRDWEICLTCGSTSALEIALRLFGEKGHVLLTEEYSFSSAMETARPLGIKPLGIKMDENGMIPELLDELLTNWDPEARDGAPKPFLLYTIPTGQNPTASTQPLERRKAIYAVAERHDLFILEDEPYYFLQMEPFVSGLTHPVTKPFQTMPITQFLDSLVPSFLSLDTSGRVMRMDSLSKVIAPGTRFGWVTAPAHIIERFIRHSEVSMQNPSGISMITLYKLLEETWGHKGFLEWLMWIRAEYTYRRDVIVNASEKYLPRTVTSFTPPAAGMFHWIKVDATRHPLWHAQLNDDGMDGSNVSLAPSLPSSSTASIAMTAADTAKLLAEVEEKIFLAGVKHSVLIARGSWFKAEKQPVGHVSDAAEDAIPSTDLFFRMTFASAPEEKIVEAVKRFGIAIEEEFQLVC